MINRHQVEGIQGFNNPLTPEAGALAKTGCDIHLEITVIANNPIHSCNYKIPMKSPLATSIEAERAYLIYSAKKIGYTGMAQIADYKSGECLTFRI